MPNPTPRGCILEGVDPPAEAGRGVGLARRNAFVGERDSMNPPLPVNAHSALDASVLVLNKMFMAIHIISVRRAFCLLVKDLAEVVTLEDGQFSTYSFASWRDISEYRAQHF